MARRRRSNPAGLLLPIVVLGGLAAAAWYFYKRKQAATASSPTRAATAAAGTWGRAEIDGQTYAFMPLPAGSAARSTTTPPEAVGMITRAGAQMYVDAYGREIKE